MMEYILGKLIDYHVKYEKITNNTIRVYGNFVGFSVVREAYEGWVEVDGRLIDYDDFDKWIYSICC